MYEKYHTDAVVLRHRPAGEADAVVALYTKDFGLVRARVSGARAERSKMRYALQTQALSSVSLVRGSRGWRVAGARAQSRFLRMQAPMCAYARVADLTLRLIAGEECNPYLFETLSRMREALMVLPEETEIIELLAVARILWALGYIPAEAIPADLTTHTRFDLEACTALAPEREHLLMVVNRALGQSHL